MIFKGLDIENFFRFKNAHIDLNDQGLVLITGENLDSTTADSNGSGKSTILEAIVWCLWGKTVRGKKGDTVVNNQIKKDCWVRLHLEHDGEEYVVERFRLHHQFQNKLFFWHYEDAGPIDLSEGNNTLTQEKITKFLGIDFETYIRGPMVGQGKFKRFSEMTDAQRKEVLEDAIQIGVLGKAREEVRKQLNQINGELTTESISHDQILDQLTHAKNDFTAILHSQESHFQETLCNIAKISSKLANFAIQIDQLTKEIPDPVDIQKFEKAAHVVEDLEYKLTLHWQRLLEGLTSEKGQLEASMGHQRTELRRLQNEAERLNSLANATCPTCEQDVSEEHINACLLALQTKTTEAEAHLEVLGAQYKSAESRYEETHKESILSRQRASTNKKQAIDQWNEALEQNQARRDVHQQIYRSMQSVLEHHKRVKEYKDSLRCDPFQSFAQEKEEQVGRLEDQLKQINSRMAELSSQVNLLQFWDSGFGNSGLKSQVLAAVTPFMNDRARYYSKHLTDGEAKIEFSTQTTLGSGELREKFDVVVSNSNGADDYDGSSGGEKGKIDLAINFTFSDLMAMRAQKAYPQRFFDEPFEALDEAGIEAVMELLAVMVKECGTIFVVTHQPAMKSLFSKVINVVKKGGVSVITD